MTTLKNMEDEERLQLGPNTDWMSRLPVALHDVPLWDLAIPGKAKTGGSCPFPVALFTLHIGKCLLSLRKKKIIKRRDGRAELTGSSHRREPRQHVLLSRRVLTCAGVGAPPAQGG